MLYIFLFHSMSPTDCHQCSQYRSVDRNKKKGYKISDKITAQQLKLLSSLKTKALKCL